MPNDRNATRRAAILTAAATVFRARGYARTTAEELAAAAGLAVGSLYNILGNKECIYLAAAEQAGRHLLNELQRFQLLVRKAPDRALRELVEFRLADYPEQRLFFELFTNEDYRRIGSGGDDAVLVRERLTAMHARYYELAAEIFRNGIDIGSFIDIDPVAAVMLLEGMIESARRGLVREQAADGLPSVTAREVTALCAAVFSAERPRPPVRERRSEREIFITRFDFRRLRELLEVAQCFGTEKNEEHLRRLENALQQAVIVSSQSIPPDVVTMNSRVTLEDRTEKRDFSASLVFPADKNQDPENISVLSPLGAALLGCAEGCRLDVGGRELSIAKILYQPEAAGDFEL